MRTTTSLLSVCLRLDLVDVSLNSHKSKHTAKCDEPPKVIQKAREHLEVPYVALKRISQVSSPFMTSPVDQLAGLSISGRMSSRTRAEAQRERRRREREERSSLAALQENLSIVLPSPDQHGTIHGSTRLRYQVGALRSPVRATAIRGLTADNLSAEAAKLHVLNNQSSYVAIQIVERLRLCIYTAPRDGRYIDCSCAEMRSKPPASVCPHIYVSESLVCIIHKTDWRIVAL